MYEYLALVESEPRNVGRGLHLTAKKVLQAAFLYVCMGLEELGLRLVQVELPSKRAGLVHF